MMRKKIARKRVAAVLSLPKVAPQSGSMAKDWVASMHDYHQKTGLYRAEDLNRVLGDPRKQVQGDVASDLLFACHVIEK
jgi:hypothetical protein